MVALQSTGVYWIGNLLSAVILYQNECRFCFSMTDSRRRHPAGAFQVRSGLGESKLHESIPPFSGFKIGCLQGAGNRGADKKCCAACNVSHA